MSRARLVSVLLGWFILPLSIQAQTKETRDFAIYIDGKESGQSTMDIAQQADGLTYMTARAQVKFQQLIINFNFHIDTAEWWKNGQLIGLKGSCSDNGKVTTLNIAQDGNQLRLKVNNQERALRADTWTNCFWKLPDAKYHNKAIPILEADTGKEYVGQLQYIGAEAIPVQGQPLKCFHFRVTGGPNNTDLWYDQFHRLVRQEFVESGHRTIIQLTAVRR